jgi:hypothetical protein
VRFHCAATGSFGKGGSVYEFCCTLVGVIPSASTGSSCHSSTSYGNAHKPVPQMDSRIAHRFASGGLKMIAFTRQGIRFCFGGGVLSSNCRDSVFFPQTDKNEKTLCLSQIQLRTAITTAPSASLRPLPSTWLLVRAKKTSYNPSYE